MSARPMIIAVWIRAAAPGCRAIASTADATALPCPSPHNPAAIAMPMPAAMTANGAIQPPVLPSAASAAVGNARTANPPRISERRTTPSSIRVLCLVVPGMWFGMVLGLLDRARDVEHRQHHEDERLQKRHQNLQRIEKAHREDDRDEAAD